MTTPTKHKNSSKTGRVTPRRRRFDYRQVPTYWLADEAGPTHVANALHVLFPPAERWFVAAARAALPMIDDPDLVADARGFISQEGTHATHHQRYLPFLEQIGVEVAPLLAELDKRFAMLSTLPLERQLAAMATLEHYTASLGKWVLSSPEIAAVEPAMRDLLRWHAAEEVEHRSVAFDLHAAIAPGYAARIRAHLVVSFGLFSVWARVALALMQQDPNTSPRRALWQLARARWSRQLLWRELLPCFVSYLRPGFHPAQIAAPDLAPFLAEPAAGTVL